MLIISIYIVPILGIPYAFSAVASPLLGIMIDKTGRNVTFITLACFITLISHALFAFTLSKGFAYLAIGLMGLGYSLLAASLWPVIALVIPLHRQGTAFGKLHTLCCIPCSAMIVFSKIFDVFNFHVLFRNSTSNTEPRAWINIFGSRRNYR